MAPSPRDSAYSTPVREGRSGGHSNGGGGDAGDGDGGMSGGMGDGSGSSSPLPAHDRGLGDSVAIGGSSRVELGLSAVSGALEITRHLDTVVALTRDDNFVYSGSREGLVQVSRLSDGVPHFSIPGSGVINCLAAHRGKLVLCSDDGQQATLKLWDACGKRLVQEVSGIRKWCAPTSICYMGYDRCFWVRDTTLTTLTWRAATTTGTAHAA